MTAPIRTDYRIGPPEYKWEIGMLGVRVAEGSDETLRFGVRADSDGRPVDPTGATFSVAFKVGTDVPESGDWEAGTWDVTLIGTYVGCVKTGASGADLAAGRYYTWVRIVDAASAETVIRQTGMVLVS